MPKNITLSLPDEMASEMEAMPEINWSAVAKTCIRQYIELRKHPDASSLLEKLQQQKGQEYVNGRKKADDIAKDLGYKGFNVLTRKYGKELAELNEREMRGPETPWETLPTAEDILQTLLVEKKLIDNDASDAFLTGLKERLSEIEKALLK